MPWHHEQFGANYSEFVATKRVADAIAIAQTLIIQIVTLVERAEVELRAQKRKNKKRLTQSIELLNLYKFMA
jgi:hypothetical protein